QKGLSRTVNSPGNATWTAGDIRIYSAGGTFNNSGTFDAQADGTQSTIFDTGPFFNTGLFKRTTSPTISSISSVFDNDGTVDVQTGGLSLAGRGGASPSTGYFGAAGTLLRCAQGTYTLGASSSVTGTNVEFGFATVNHAGTYNVTGSTDIAGGQVHFTGTVTNVGAALDISGGTA